MSGRNTHLKREEKLLQKTVITSLETHQSFLNLIPVI